MAPSRPTSAQRRQVASVNRIVQRRDGALVASGSYLVPNIKRAAKYDRSKASTNAQSWQTDAANFVEVIGPLRYALHRIAETVALGNLVISEKGRESLSDEGEQSAEERAERTEQWAPTLNADANKLLSDLHGDNGEGHDEILKMAALHLQIYGESFLIGAPDDRTETLMWEFISPEELTGQKGSYKRRSGGEDEKVGAEDFVARMHNPDYRFSDRPDCALRSSLPICGEIVGLQKYVDAIIESRLNAGILAIPTEIVESYDSSIMPSEATVSNDAGDQDDDEQPDFLSTFADHLIAPVEDRSNPSSLVPLILTGEPDALNAIRLITLGSELDSYFSELRAEVYDLLAQSLDLPKEIMQGRSSLNHWCNDASTEILTSQGWKDIDTMEPGLLVLSLNHDTGLTEWKPVTDVYRAEVEDEPMLSLEGNVHSSLTTANHRWPVERHLCGDCADRLAEAKGRCLRCRKRQVRAVGAANVEPTSSIIERRFVTSDEMREGDRVILGAESADLPSEAKWSDAMVETVAWSSTDACLRGRENHRQRLTIRQSPSANPHKVESIRAALIDTFGSPVDRLDPGLTSPVEWSEGFDSSVGCVEFRLSAGTLDMMLDEGILELNDTRLNASLDFVRQLTKAQLHLFLATCAAGNGHEAEDQTSSLFASDDARLDAAQLAATLLGYRTSITDHKPSDEAFTDTVLRRLSWGPQTRMKVDGKAEWTSYSGRIWCPTVADNHTYLARRNGRTFYTGNSGFQLDADFVAKHVSPIGRRIATFLTRNFLRPMLIEFHNMSKEEAQRYRIDFSVDHLLKSQDEGNVALTLHERILISDEAARLANGFDEQDAPSEEERLQRILESLMPSLPSAIWPLLEQLMDFESLGIEVAPTTDVNAGSGSLFEPGFGAALGGEPAAPPGAGAVNDGPGVTGQPATPDSFDETPPSPALSLLRERLATCGDRDVQRALEIVGSRVLSNARKVDGLSDKLRHTKKVDVLSHVRPADVEAMGIDLEREWKSALGESTRAARSWLAQYAANARGVAPLEAAEWADETAERYYQSLIELTVSLAYRQVTPGPNGLLVSDEMIDKVLNLASV